MKFYSQFNLAAVHTMRSPAFADKFVRICSQEQHIYAHQYAKTDEMRFLILGGGSNLVFTNDYPGLVIQMANKGITYERLPDTDDYSVCAQAGEEWHGFVWKTLQCGLCGLENLALIPGTVGAAPIQNIGAYGVELKESLNSVQVLHRDTSEIFELSADDCNFGYRDSIFKHKEGKDWIILSVTFRLSKNAPLHLDYADLKQQLEASNLPVTAKSVAKTVERIRRSKLPDPADIPNAGSFFKNPVVKESLHRALIAEHPDMPFFRSAGGNVKIPAAWLIQQCGWKGRITSGVGMHAKQALVLTNPGSRPGSELLSFALCVKDSVEKNFGIVLETEPVIV